MRCSSKLSRLRCASNCSGVSLGLASPRRRFADSICASTDLLSQPRATLHYTLSVRLAKQRARLAFSAAPKPGRIWRRRPETPGTRTARIHRLPGCGSASSYAGASRRIRTKSWNRPRIDTSPISDVSYLRLPASYKSSADPRRTTYSQPRHSVASTKAPAGFAERAPAEATIKAVQQRSKLPDRRVEICTLLCRVPIQAGFVASLTISLKMYDALSS